MHSDNIQKRELMEIVLSPSASTVGNWVILQRSAIIRADHLNATAAIKRAIRQKTVRKEIVRWIWSAINVMSWAILHINADVRVYWNVAWWFSIKWVLNNNFAQYFSNKIQYLIIFQKTSSFFFWLTKIFLLLTLSSFPLKLFLHIRPILQFLPFFFFSAYLISFENFAFSSQMPNK